MIGFAVEDTTVVEVDAEQEMIIDKALDDCINFAPGGDETGEAEEAEEEEKVVDPEIDPDDECTDVDLVYSQHILKRSIALGAAPFRPTHQWSAGVSLRRGRG